MEIEGNAYLLEAFAALAYLVAGLRLLALAGRTGKSPERLLGCVFVLTGASYVAYVTPIVFRLDALWTPMVFLGRILYVLAMTPLLFFTRRVFRRHEAWARYVVWAGMLLMGVGVGVSAARGDWEGMYLSSPWFWCEWVGYTAPYVWVGVEGLLEYRSARLRVRLELSDPIVCNRFLLWTFLGVVQVGASLSVIPMYSAYEVSHTISLWSDTALGLCEIVSVVLVWLVFFPPDSYRLWVAGASSDAAGEA